MDADVPENHNLYNPTDVNGDGSTSAGDALSIINQLNRSASIDGDSISGMCDVNGDGLITARNALMVINELQSPNSSDGATAVTVGVDEITKDEQADENKPSDEEVGGDEMSDGGSTIDETTDVDDTRDDYHHGHFRRRGFVGGFLRGGAEALVNRFDTSADGILTEDEVPLLLWQKLIDQGSDANEDAMPTAEEIAAAVIAS